MGNTLNTDETGRYKTSFAKGSIVTAKFQNPNTWKFIASDQEQSIDTDTNCGRENNVSRKKTFYWIENVTQ